MYNIPAGLSASDLNMADQDSVDEMSSDGLTHIPPAVFGVRVLSPHFLSLNKSLK